MWREKNVGTRFANVLSNVANPSAAGGMGLGGIGSNGEIDAAHRGSGGREKSGHAAGRFHGDAWRHNAARVVVPCGGLDSERGKGTVFPAKRTTNGLSDLVDLHFVAGKISQSPGCERLRETQTPSERMSVILFAS